MTTNKPATKTTLCLLTAGLAAVNASAFTTFLRMDENILIDPVIAANGSVSGGTDTGIVYTGNTDAEIREDEPTSSFDTGTGDSDPGDAEITVDADDPDASGFESQGLLRFEIIDPASLPGAPVSPAGYSVVSATLFLDFDNNGDDVELYMLGAGTSWDETTVTWNNFGTSADDGVVVGSDTLGSPIVLDGAAVDKEFIDVTTMVQAWFSGAEANNGWAFLPTGPDGVDFDISEENLPGEIDRPHLAIEFEAIPEPASTALFLVGLCALSTLRRR